MTEPALWVWDERLVEAPPEPKRWPAGPRALWVWDLIPRVMVRALFEREVERQQAAYRKAWRERFPTGVMMAVPRIEGGYEYVSVSR